VTKGEVQRQQLVVSRCGRVHHPQVHSGAVASGISQGNHPLMRQQPFGVRDVGRACGRRVVGKGLSPACESAVCAAGASASVMGGEPPRPSVRCGWSQADCRGDHACSARFIMRTVQATTDTSGTLPWPRQYAAEPGWLVLIRCWREREERPDGALAGRVML
jgi:hypothetical protein